MRSQIPIAIAIFVGLAPSLVAWASPESADEKTDAERSRELAELFSRARLLGRDGDAAGSNAAYLAYLEKLPKGDGPLDPRRAGIHLSIAGNHIALHAPEAALEHLRRAVDLGTWEPSRFSRDPDFAPLREHPGFAELLDYARTAPARMAFGRRDTEGKEIDAKDYENKVMIIDVWGTWCPPCRREIPAFIELASKYRKHGLEIIGVTHEKKEPSAAVVRQVSAFAKSQGINYRLAVVGRDLIEAVPIGSYPTTFFVDHTGKIAHKFIGAQSQYDLEVAAVRLLNKKILADAEARKKAEAAQEGSAKAPESSAKSSANPSAKPSSPSSSRTTAAPRAEAES